MSPASTYSGIRAKIMDRVQRLTSTSGKRMPTPMDCSLLDSQKALLQQQQADLAKAQGSLDTLGADGSSESAWTCEHNPNASPDRTRT